MIHPRNLLILWACLWLIAAALLWSAWPALRWLWAAMAAVGALVAVADAVLSWRLLDGVHAEMPPTLRLTRGSSGSVEVRLWGPREGMPLEVGLALPEELDCQQYQQTVRLKGPRSSVTAGFECHPTSRGRWTVDKVYLATHSPLRFWRRRAIVPACCELQVYPDLSGERRRLAGLFLNRGGPGAHAQRQLGRGREIEQLREYVHGDAYNEIHWKASARRGQPITKVFQLERTQEVYVAIDHSRLSARLAGGGENRGQTLRALDRFVSAAMILQQVAQRQGDLFGLLTFSDRVDCFMRARGGAGHYRACRGAIHALQSRPVAPDFAEVFTTIRQRLRRRALVMILTDLDDPILAESFTRACELICRQHLLLVAMITPGGVGEIFSDPRVNDRLDVCGQLVGHLRLKRLRELETDLRRKAVGMGLVDSGELCPHMVGQYLAVKGRQLL